MCCKPKTKNWKKILSQTYINSRDSYLIAKWNNWCHSIYIILINIYIIFITLWIVIALLKHNVNNINNSQFINHNSVSEYDVLYLHTFTTLPMDFWFMRKSVSCDKSIGAFKKSWRSNCFTPWKSPSSALRPSKSTWICCRKQNISNMYKIMDLLLILQICEVVT